MHLNSGTNPRTGTSLVCLAVGAMPLGWPWRTPLSYSIQLLTSLSCPGSVVRGHGWSVQTQGAGRPGKRAGYPVFLALLCSLIRRIMLVATLTGIISLRFQAKGEKIATDYVCRIMGGGEDVPSCGATWGPIVKIRENWSIGGIPLVPGIFYSPMENSRWLSSHLSMIYCKKFPFIHSQSLVNEETGIMRAVCNKFISQSYAFN